MLTLIYESMLLFGQWINENVIRKELGSYMDVQKAVNDFMEGELHDGREPARADHQD